MEALKHARVAVFGIGGVGGYACEALVRSGVGAFDLIDDDKVCLTNINPPDHRHAEDPSASIRPTSCATVCSTSIRRPISAYTAASSCRKRRRVPVFGI